MAGRLHDRLADRFGEGQVFIEEAALVRDVRVIPILVEGAVMPTREDLPENLAGLARRNALRIRHESFRSDAGRLMTAIERVLAAPGAAEVEAVQVPGQGAWQRQMLAELYPHIEHLQGHPRTHGPDCRARSRAGVIRRHQAPQRPE